MFSFFSFTFLLFHFLLVFSSFPGKRLLLQFDRVRGLGIPLSLRQSVNTANPNTNALYFQVYTRHDTSGHTPYFQVTYSGKFFSRFSYITSYFAHSFIHRLLSNVFEWRNLSS